MSTIKIDPEFKALIPPLAPEEYAQLEANILQDGCRDPLVLWDGIIIDGHNRYEICTKHGIGFEKINKTFADRESVMDWMDANQLGRRNLKPDQFTLLLGRRYNRTKRSVGRPKNGDNLSQLSPAEELGKQHGVDARTVKRAGQFAAAVDKLKDAAPDLSATVTAGTAKPRRDVIKAAALLDEKPEKAMEILHNGKSAADVTREIKREEVIAKLEDVAAVEAKAISGEYDVIVMDPPWQMEKIERDVAPNQVAFEYPTMTEAELRGLWQSVDFKPATDCHLWMWTTHKHLPMAIRLLESWSMKYVCTFV